MVITTDKVLGLLKTKRWERPVKQLRVVHAEANFPKENGIMQDLKIKYGQHVHSHLEKRSTLFNKDQIKNLVIEQFDKTVQEVQILHKTCRYTTGISTMADITDESLVIYGYRRDRNIPSRCVLRDKIPVEYTNDLTAIAVLYWGLSADILVISAWAGPPAEREVQDSSLQDDPAAEQAAREFWQTHAIIVESDEIVAPSTYAEYWA